MPEVGDIYERVAGKGPEKIRITGQQGSMWLARSLDVDFGPVLVFPPDSLAAQYGVAAAGPTDGEQWPDDPEWLFKAEEAATREIEAAGPLLTAEQKLAAAEAEAERADEES